MEPPPPPRAIGNRTPKFLACRFMVADRESSDYRSCYGSSGDKPSKCKYVEFWSPHMRDMNLNQMLELRPYLARERYILMPWIVKSVIVTSNFIVIVIFGLRRLLWMNAVIFWKQFVKKSIIPFYGPLVSDWSKQSIFKHIIDKDYLWFSKLFTMTWRHFSFLSFLQVFSNVLFTSDIIHWRNV